MNFWGNFEKQLVKLLHENSEKISGKFEEILEENRRILKWFPKHFKRYWKKKKKIVDHFSMNFGSTIENIAEILRKFLKFLTDFIEVFKILTLGNNVSWKLQGNSILIPEN